MVIALLRGFRARSIRARLLIGILLSLLVILGAAAWWSYEVTQHESEEIFSARLATSARVLEALVAPSVEHATIVSPLVIALPRELEHTSTDRGSALGHPYETKIAFQIWREDGTLLARSTSASTRPFSPNVPGFSMQTIDGLSSHVFVLHSGATWIQVSEKDEVRSELLHDLGVAVMTPLVVGGMLLLVLVNVLVVYALAPLRQLAASIAMRDPGSLGEVQLRDAPQELAPLVRELNELLQRVSLAFEHERRFTDAAAHELRTPLAALKIHAENVARASDDAQRAQSMQKLRQGLERASKLASQLLAYSRAQNAADREERIAIRLVDVVREAIAGTETIRQCKRQQVNLQADADAERAEIRGEPVNIQRLVFNLLDNAARYAPDGSTIEVSVSSDRGGLALAVANEGAAIAPELRERVFEPYYRIPGSGSEGSGLGLAIVREIASQHGASVELRSLAPSEGTLVTVCFPQRRRAPAG